MKRLCKYLFLATATTLLASCESIISPEAELLIDFTKKGAEVNPKMYGIFFEEINHSGDGSLYAELIRNRNFEEAVIPSGTIYKDGYAISPHKPSYTTGKCNDWRTEWKTDSLKMVGWSVKGNAEYDIVSERPLHQNTPYAMKLSIKKAGVILQNEGYWGVPVKKNDKYDLRFYLYSVNYEGVVKAKIISENGKVLSIGTFQINKKNCWMEYTAELLASDSEYNGKFQLEFETVGTVYVDYVSLFPQKTFKNRKNGMRQDVAQMLADLKPGFIRWPGGCIAEGATLENRVKWKETLGDPMTRKSEWILWNYHCSWGFGYHEFLQLCEDLGSDAMFVTNVGLSCEVRNGDFTNDLKPFIKDIEDAIEYAKGDVSTTWGAKRARAGHPKPFNLKYIELGNEQIGDMYAERYNYLYNILKIKYPEITFISTIGLNKTTEKLDKVDMIDPHWYVNSQFFYDNDNLFDKISRGKFDIYVGEYAVISEANMNAALSEAAFISGMEKNSDLVKIASYAPLLENNNKRDWPTNLIWVNNKSVIGRASYYVQKMYSNNIPTYNISSEMDEHLDSPFNGYLGFAGDNIKDQYRNLKITDQNEKVILKTNDFSKMMKVADTSSGKRAWMVSPTVSFLKDIIVNKGTVEFESRLTKIPRSSFNLGFALQSDSIANIPALIFGADKDCKNYFTLNLGYDSESSVIYMSRTSDGQSVFGRDPQGPEFKMNPNEWYKVKIEFRDDDHISCYINGKEIYKQNVKTLTKHYAICGYDEKSGETIIKVVNATDKSFTLNIKMNCASVKRLGKVTTLKANNITDENSFYCPLKVSPFETTFDGFCNNFTYTFDPYSFNIMRVKTDSK